MKPTPTHLTVACCQLAPRVGDLEHNRQQALAAIRAAASQGAQVVVLPELVQSGYVFIDKAEALSLAETAHGETLRQWAVLATELDVVIVGGFCERTERDELYNSAALIDANGVQAVYRKAHLWNDEKRFFTPGNCPPPVVETRFGRIAVMICYDLEFPEWVRLPALAGAELLCAPVNWPDGPRPAGERPAEVVRVQANASVTRCGLGRRLGNCRCQRLPLGRATARRRCRPCDHPCPPGPQRGPRQAHQRQQSRTSGPPAGTLRLSALRG